MCSSKNAEPSRNKQISFSNFQHRLKGCTEYTCTAPGTCTHTSEGGKLISQSKQNWDNFQATKRIQNLNLLPFPVKIKQRFLYPSPPSPPYHCDFAKNQTNSGEYQQGFLGFFGQKDNRGPPLPPTPLIFYLYERIYRPEIWHVTPQYLPQIRKKQNPPSPPSLSFLQKVAKILYLDFWPEGVDIRYPCIR